MQEWCLKGVRKKMQVVGMRSVYCQGIRANSRLYGKLCMHTLLSTDIERTAASVLLDIGGPSVLFDGKNCKPVTNIKWADGMCKTR